MDNHIMDVPNALQIHTVDPADYVYIQLKGGLEIFASSTILSTHSEVFAAKLEPYLKQGRTLAFGPIRVDMKAEDPMPLANLVLLLHSHHAECHELSDIAKLLAVALIAMEYKCVAAVKIPLIYWLDVIMKQTNSSGQLYLGDAMSFTLIAYIVDHHMNFSWATSDLVLHTPTSTPFSALATKFNMPSFEKYLKFGIEQLEIKRKQRQDELMKAVFEWTKPFHDANPQSLRLMNEKGIFNYTRLGSPNKVLGDLMIKWHNSSINLSDILRDLRQSPLSPSGTESILGTKLGSRDEFEIRAFPAGPWRREQFDLNGLCLTCIKKEGGEHTLMCYSSHGTAGEN